LTTFLREEIKRQTPKLYASFAGMYRWHHKNCHSCNDGFCSSEAHLKDLKQIPEGKSSFSPHTSNPSLRVHLDKYHREAYKTFCMENHFPNQLPSHKVISEWATAGSVIIGEAGVHSLPKFSQTQLIKYIINFIVADDQVS